MALLVSMTAVIVTWLAWSAALVGIGGLVIRGLDPRDPRDSLALRFWAGYAAVLPVLIAAHFVTPMSGWVHWTMLVVGVVLAATRVRGPIVSSLRTMSRGRWIAAVVLTIWLANRACGPGVATDAGSYHYPAIDWSNAYPAVPGLANFSQSQAMNNSSFLFAAMLNAGPWNGRVEHVVTGLLVFVSMLMTLAPLARAFNRVASPADWSLVAMLPMLLFVSLGSEISTPDTDVPPGLLTLAVGHFVIRQFFPCAPGDDDPRRLPVLAVLVAGLVTLKLSAGMFAVLLAIALLVHHARRQPLRSWLRPGLASASIVLVIGLAWTARGVRLSGYPLYPSAALGLDVEWRLPEDRLTYLQEAISKTPRAQVPLWLYGVMENSPLRFYAPLMKPPFEDYAGVTATNWIRPWFFTLPFTGSVEFILPTLLAAILLVIHRRRDGLSTAAALLLLPVVAVFALWFLASPDARYVWGVAWFGVGAAAALLASRGRSPSRALLVMLLVVTLLPAVGYKSAVHLMIHHRNPLRSIPFMPPGTDHGMHPRPVAVYERWTSRHGVEVFLQTTDTLCWQGPLPRVGWPTPDPDLAYRQPGNLAAGFLIRRDGR